MKNRQIYFWMFLAICAISFVFYNFYRNDKANYEFYQEEIHYEIKSVQKTTDGFYLIGIENEIIPLGLHGDCIDTIYCGDSIIKYPFSNEIIIKHKKEGYKAHKYDCSN
jgi:hypothetical protein